MAFLKLDTAEVGEAFQGIRADTLDYKDYYSLEDGDTLAVEGMFVVGDSMTVGLGVDTKVQSLQMEYPYMACSHILSYAI